MPVHIVLLRAVNLGPRNRVPMPRLRDALAARGFDDVRTHLASGNVFVSSRKGAARVAQEVGAAIQDEFGLAIDVVTRSRDELAATVAANPFTREVEAGEPKRLQVVFLAGDPDPDAVRALEGAELAPEAVAVHGRDVFCWHANGIQDSPLSKLLGRADLGTIGTARNWNTVRKLLELADA